MVIFATQTIHPKPRTHQLRDVSAPFAPHLFPLAVPVDTRKLANMARRIILGTVYSWTVGFSAPRRYHQAMRFTLVHPAAIGTACARRRTLRRISLLIDCLFYFLSLRCLLCVIMPLTYFPVDLFLISATFFGVVDCLSS